MPKTSHKDLSRTKWVREGDGWPGVEIIQSGCLQRIADATELMAKDRQDLINERDQYKGFYEHRRDQHEAAIRSIRAYKAHITRLNRRVAHLEKSRTILSEGIELQKAISQFTGWHYRPEYGIADLAQSMGLKPAEYADIREDLCTFLREQDINELDELFNFEEPASV